MSLPPGRGEDALRREIGVVLATLLVVNSTIGTGIFKIPTKVANLTGTTEVFLLVWIAGGLIALCGALSLAELTAAWPRAGGIYEHLRRAYGPGAAFLFGWTKLTLFIPAAAGSFAKLAAEAGTSLLGLPPDPVRDKVVPVLFIAGCVGANLIGVRASALQQGILTTAKYAGILALAAIGLLVPVSAGAVPVPAGPAVTSAATAMTALVTVMWAYDGWADVSNLGGEIRRPDRVLPRALITGTALIVVVYLLANAGYLTALGIDGLRGSTAIPAHTVATATLGVVGGQLLTALILVSCVSAAMGSLLTSPRSFVPLAADGLFFPWLGVVSPRSGVPARGVLLGGALGCSYVLFRSFEQLTEAFVVGYALFYMAAIFGVYVLRAREPLTPRPFRTPGYPVVPALFLAGNCVLLYGALRAADYTAFFALGIIALGVPLYLFVFRRRFRPV